MKNALKTESGFTLIEILIAAGLLGLLALVVSSLFFYAGKQQSRIQGRGAVFEFQQQLMLDLKIRPLPTP